MPQLKLPLEDLEEDQQLQYHSEDRIFLKYILNCGEETWYLHIKTRRRLTPHLFSQCKCTTHLTYPCVPVSVPQIFSCPTCASTLCGTHTLALNRIGIG